jgi:HSP20 family protein
MTSQKRAQRVRNGSAWEPVTDILEGVEQAVAGGWYPARAMLMSRLAEAAGRQLPVWVPEADEEETGREIIVSFALPGVDRSDIRVNITATSITVSGRRRAEIRSHKGSRRELPSGDFMRRVRLFDEVKPASAKAVFRNGVLRVTLARAHAQSGRSVKVE